MDNSLDSDSVFLYHIPCEHCGSSDGNSLFSDGHQYCYVCEKWVPGDDQKRSEIANRRPKGGNYGMNTQGSIH